MPCQLGQPGCEAAEANAQAMLDQCEQETKQFEAERDEYVTLLNNTLQELDKSLAYWKKLANDVHDDFRSSPLLDPSAVMLHSEWVPSAVMFGKLDQSPTGCDQVARMHLRVQQCRSLLTTAQTYARKTILGMEGQITDKRTRLAGYKTMVARMRAEESGGWER
jgi:hypothetical protein